MPHAIQKFHNIWMSIQRPPPKATSAWETSPLAVKLGLEDQHSKKKYFLILIQIIIYPVGQLSL